MTTQRRAAADGSPVVGTGDDDAAIIRLSWREPERFAILYHRHAPQIQRYVLRRLGPAGRRGVAFRLPLASPNPVYKEIILNPRTYQFMSLGNRSQAGLNSSAMLVQAPVSGPGIRP
jgi:hypothetical protein